MMTKDVSSLTRLMFDEIDALTNLVTEHITYESHRNTDVQLAEIGQQLIA